MIRLLRRVESSFDALVIFDCRSSFPHVHLLIMDAGQKRMNPDDDISSNNGKNKSKAIVVEDSDTDPDEEDESRVHVNPAFVEIRLHVETVSIKTFTLKVRPTDSVLYVKEQIALQEGQCCHHYCIDIPYTAHFRRHSCFRTATIVL